MEENRARRTSSRPRWGATSDPVFLVAATSKSPITSAHSRVERLAAGVARPRAARGHPGPRPADSQRIAPLDSFVRATGGGRIEARGNARDGAPRAQPRSPDRRPRLALLLRLRGHSPVVRGRVVRVD